MNRLIVFCLILIFSSCKNEKDAENKIQQKAKIEYSSVEIESILEDDSLSIRAIEIIGNNLAFAANKGTFGMYNFGNSTWRTNTQKYDSLVPEYRAVASTDTDFFMLSVGSPALLYKTGDSGAMELVYKEENEKAFYDAMAFWNNKEGIAMGDPTNNCISIIITRDGGKTWKKLSCDLLPEVIEGEAAFAASNSNIAIEGDKTWILSGGMTSRVYFSPDKGETWEVFDTPLLDGKSTTGGYTMDFYDEDFGIILGGDYTNPEGNTGNKAITKDGGKTWELIAEGQEPGYKSSVRFIPKTGGEKIIATGFSGISISKDSGKTWKELSKEGFYTLRFKNDSVAYAAGKGRIAKLTFR
ncbi:WD40/YVTN/BNR-like repeat-containing protein [Salegentibacter salarius]|uniref:Oxidoreductase n=1 Tax=Salegentibacter salarius TaxID=435906 RepID=A0A2N0TVS9_9FLAO|nr:oxidoreductase [Salegentibacter salarius]OEY72581.1 oxidoreductase [Salegentibacter salarius]PKD18840.1 oxidoreductase [Salegentibacter salarius]SLK01784.1 Sortilin, neurotensin receptor 3 [Salegentibacter salarius]